MVAAFFFYYNFKFKEYKFIDFNKITLYTKNNIFTPKSNEYYLVLFSSKMENFKEILKQVPKDHPVLTVDFFQKRVNYPNIIYTTAGINTIIKLIQYLNIYHVPVMLKIKRYNKNLYKQDSPLINLKE